jgi:hypothetical protein
MYFGVGTNISEEHAAAFVRDESRYSETLVHI